MGPFFVGGLTPPIPARYEYDRQSPGHQQGNHCGRDRDKDGGHHGS